MPRTARATQTMPPAVDRDSCPTTTGASAAARNIARKPHGRGGAARCRRVTPSGVTTSPRDASAPTATPSSMTASTTRTTCHHAGVTVVGTSWSRGVLTYTFCSTVP